jgi:hypothetical protein
MTNKSKKYLPIYINKDTQDFLDNSLHGREFIDAIRLKFDLEEFMAIAIYKSVADNSLYIDILHVHPFKDCRIYVEDVFLSTSRFQINEEVGALLTIYQEKMQKRKGTKAPGYFVVIDRLGQSPSYQ